MLREYVDSGRNRGGTGRRVFSDDDFSELTACVNLLHSAVVHGNVVWPLALRKMGGV